MATRRAGRKYHKRIPAHPAADADVQEDRSISVDGNEDVMVSLIASDSLIVATT